MIPTRIAIAQGKPRARLNLVVGGLAPRLTARGSASAHVAVAAAQMLLLAGDRVEIEVDVGPGCVLEIEDVGGTVAYPGTASASWSLRARVGAGGLLLWKGLPFVVASGARVERHTDLHLESDAAAVVRETLVLGRHGEKGGRIDALMSVRDSEGPVLAERLDVAGGRGQPGVLGADRVCDAVIAVGFRPSPSPGALELEAPGAIARHLSLRAHSSPLDAVWNAWAGDARERINLPAGG